MNDDTSKWERIFLSLDLDGDQRIDFHEFYVAVINHALLFTETNLKILFKIFVWRRHNSIRQSFCEMQLPTTVNRHGTLSSNMQHSNMYASNNQVVQLQQQNECSCLTSGRDPNKIVKERWERVFRNLPEEIDYETFKDLILREV